ncbi:MAG: hypothetical protein AB7I19_09440 [Planctomycetota bacterium]
MNKNSLLTGAFAAWAMLVAPAAAQEPDSVRAESRAPRNPELIRVLEQARESLDRENYDAARRAVMAAIELASGSRDAAPRSSEGFFRGPGRRTEAAGEARAANERAEAQRDRDAERAQREIERAHQELDRAREEMERMREKVMRETELVRERAQVEARRAIEDALRVREKASAEVEAVRERAREESMRAKQQAERAKLEAVRLREAASREVETVRARDRQEAERIVEEERASTEAAPQPAGRIGRVRSPKPVSQPLAAGPRPPLVTAESSTAGSGLLVRSKQSVPSAPRVAGLDRVATGPAASSAVHARDAKAAATAPEGKESSNSKKIEIEIDCECDDLEDLLKAMHGELRAIRGLMEKMQGRSDRVGVLMVPDAPTAPLNLPATTVAPLFPTRSARLSRSVPPADPMVPVEPASPAAPAEPAIPVDPATPTAPVAPALPATRGRLSPH